MEEHQDSKAEDQKFIPNMHLKCHAHTCIWAYTAHGNTWILKVMSVNEGRDVQVHAYQCLFLKFPTYIYGHMLHAQEGNQRK